MKTTVKFSDENEIIKITFDIFEAVWGYLLFDNVALLADANKNRIELFSFASGKEQTSGDLKKEVFEKLSKCESYTINYTLGDGNSALYKNEPIDTTGKFLEAITAQYEGKLSTATECYKAVIEANPKNFRAYNLLARCYRADGKLDEALDCYNKAIELTQNSPELYCNLAILFQKQGLDEKAQEAFCKAIDIDNFYCNALVKRASWLLENDPDNKDLILYNLRLSAVHDENTNAQNHIKNYMKVMGYDRIDYSDKETAYFGEFADYKLQKQLKLIENYINNGAYGFALTEMKNLLESTKESSVKDKVACWCNSRAKRSSLRLGEKANHEIWMGFNKIVEETPTEADLVVLAEEALRLEALEKAMKEDRETAKKREEEALAAIENKVTEDGDYSQPIGVPIQKKITEEEKREALKEQSLLRDVPVSAPKQNTKPVVEDKKVEPIKDEKKVSVQKDTVKAKPELPKEQKPTAKPIKEEKVVPEAKKEESKEIEEPKASEASEDSLLTGVDDIPAPTKASDSYDLLTAIEEIPAPPPVSKPSSSEPSKLTFEDIPAPKPVLGKLADEVPAPKPINVPSPVLTKKVEATPISEPAKEEKQDIVDGPVPSTDDLLTGVDDIPAPPPSSSYDLLTGVDDIPAPSPVRASKTMSEDDLLSGNDDIPAPKSISAKKPAPVNPVTSDQDINIKPKTTAELMAEANNKVDISEIAPGLKPKSTAELMAEANNKVDISEMAPGLKPKSTAELMAEANNTYVSKEEEPLLRPKTTAELMAEAKNALLPPEPVFGPKRSNIVQESKPVLMPKTTAELMAEAKNVVLPPEPVLIKRPDTKGIELSKDYKSPVKNVKPVTIQEFFMLVLFEVMRDGNIEKSEENFLKNLKNQLNISDDDFKKMFNHVKKQVQTKGYKKEEGSFNPKRLFKNLCQAAWRDGVLEDSEKQLLMKVCKGFGIPNDEAKKIMVEAKKLADVQNTKEDNK